ncbi:hypothetical protein MBLNU13_g07938t1 [Cladosporium sp. NU13]
MPTHAEFLDGRALMLGALFLVDHAPECPEEMSWHEFSNWAIAEHLKRHSYYYHQKGNREVATVAKVRSRILYICNNYAKPQMPKPGNCDKEFKDKVDVLFGYGRTNLSKKSFLDGEGYDKSTFSESRLNKHVSEKDTPANAKVNGRRKDGTSKDDQGSVITETNSHDVGDAEERHESEVHATAPPPVRPTLFSPSSQRGTTLQPTGNSLTAPNSNIVDNHERRDQNGTISHEPLSPSRNERRRLRISMGPRTQNSSADNDTSCLNERINTTPSEDTLGPHNACVLGAKRKPTQDQWPHKRQCQVNNAAHQDNPRALEVPQNAVTSRKKQHEPQLASLNLDEQGWNMERLYTDILRATDDVLASIGQIRNIPSPLQPDASGTLEDLTPEVTTSLLSAFIYEKLLTPRARLEEFVGDVMRIGGSLGEALLEEFDLSTRKAAITKRARMIEAHKACARLAQDSETLQQQLKLEADGLAKDASKIMAPHLAALSCSAKHHMLSSGRPETDTLKVVESAFVKVILRALHYRLQLLATGCEYTLTWPSPDDVFDSRNMQVDGGGSENDNEQSIVLFTVFPGLGIKPMSSNEMESLPDAKAVVMVQRSEDRS